MLTGYCRCLQNYQCHGPLFLLELFAHIHQNIPGHDIGIYSGLRIREIVNQPKSAASLAGCGTSLPCPILHGPHAFGAVLIQWCRTCSGKVLHASQRIRRYCHDLNVGFNEPLFGAPTEEARKLQYDYRPTVNPKEGGQP